MEKTAVQKLAGALKILVIITFVCNLIALLLVPGMVHISVHQGLAEWWRYDTDDTLAMLLLGGWSQWGQNGAYADVLSAFLLFCGVCTAVVLWQARRVLDTVLEGLPFQEKNSKSLRLAAVCSFLISAAALVRLIWGLAYYRTIEPLLSYNALFVPVFFMAGLLCLVMSALFRQAAELKAENDLTI
ncbi:DUF2975 domain-containing protein [Flavonifractor sp. HCP28S3_F3]|uniref:DUF2975 domain-containing protein n=1 Tax=Flavonifractor sp. HCP28S3_F3 TaxID=3438939 RepID=UPI003F8CD6A9